jgi:hypothetical protein
MVEWLTQKRELLGVVISQSRKHPADDKRKGGGVSDEMHHADTNESLVPAEQDAM